MAKVVSTIPVHQYQFKVSHKDTRTIPTDAAANAAFFTKEQPKDKLKSLDQSSN